MLHWSVMPAEYVFDGVDKQEYNWIETDVAGVKMLVEPLSEQPGYARIVRLLSPDPAVYLKACYQPGQSICLFTSHS